MAFVSQSITLLVPDFVKVFTTALTSIVLAKILGPEQLGLYASAALVMTYGTLLHFGLVQGAGLKIPVLIGQGHDADVEDCLQVLFTSVMFILSTVTPFFLIVIFLVFENPLLIFGLAINWIALIIFEIYNVVEAKVRLNYRISTVAKSQMLLNATRLFTACLGTYYFGIIGAFVALIISFLPSLIYLLWFKGEGIAIRWDKKESIELLKSGFPLFIAGFLMTCFLTVDRLFILKFEGVGSLGYYTFIVGISAILIIIPQKVASLLAQYIREAVGANVNHTKILHVTGIVYLSFFIILIPVILMMYHFAIYLITGYLTDYVESIALLKVLIFLSLSQTGYHFFSQYLIGINAKSLIIKAQALGLVAIVFYTSLSVYFGAGLHGIAVANLAASGSLTVFILIYVARTGCKFEDLRIIPSILIVLCSIYIFNLIGTAELQEIKNLKDGFGTFIKIMLLDAFLFFSVLFVAYKSALNPSVKAFLNRDFKNC